MDNTTHYSEAVKFLNREANNEFVSRAERRLWTLLLSKKQSGARFFRNQNVGDFIAPFICPKLKLIVIPRSKTKDLTTIDIQDHTIIYFSEEEIISCMEQVERQLKMLISKLSDQEINSSF